MKVLEKLNTGLDKIFIVLCFTGMMVVGGGVGVLLERNLDTEPIQAVVHDCQKYMNSVVHIQVVGKDDYYDYSDDYMKKYSTWQGSGCVISEDGIIMTARHVLQDAESIVVTFADGTSLDAIQWMEADNLDVGFIKVDAKFGDYLSFAESQPVLGDEVWIYGNPLGWMNNFSVTQGIVSNVKRDCEGFFGEFLMIQSDSPSWPGNSGGPVLNEEGEIVGVLVGGIGGNECLSYISPSWICKEWSDVFREWLECKDAEGVRTQVESSSPEEGV